MVDIGYRKDFYFSGLTILIDVTPRGISGMAEKNGLKVKLKISWQVLKSKSLKLIKGGSNMLYTVLCLSNLKQLDQLVNDYISEG